MPAQSATLESISSRLDGVRASIRRLYLLNGLATLVIAVCTFAVATFVLDYFLILPRGVRLTFLIAGLGGFGWLAARRIAYPLAVKISDDDLALFVERHYPHLNDRLISAIQLGRAPKDDPAVERIAGFNSPELVDALVADATTAAEQLDFRAVLLPDVVRRAAAGAAVLLVVIGALALSSGAGRNLASIYVRRALGFDTRWPQRTYLVVRDFDPGTHTLTIARGDDLVLAVGFRGDHPGAVKLDYEFESGDRGKETMTETDGRVFIHKFTQVPGPFSFVVRGNDDVTERHRVFTKTPPSIEEMQLFYAYPEYLKMANTPADQPVLGGNIVAPQYTSVRIIAVCNEDIAEAALKIGIKGKEADATLVIHKDAQGRDRLLTGTIEVKEAYSEYQLFLAAKNGLRNPDDRSSRPPIRFTIKGNIDARPQVAMIDPTGEENVTEVCERPITAEIKDDNGIAEILFEYRKDGKVSTDWVKVVMGAEHMRPTAYGPGVKAIKVDTVLHFAPIGAVPGEYVRIRVTAYDYKNVGGERNMGQSKEYRFAVVPLTQLEKELQDQLEKVKQNLEALRKRQNTLYEGTSRIDRKFNPFDALNAEQAGEIRYASNEQSGVTDKLAAARTDVERIRRRGVYNKIFDERAAAELGKAVEALDVVIQPAGASPLATAQLREASKSKRDPRSQALNMARQLQSQVLTAIDNALRFLDRWSNYQEIVRLVRWALEEQQKVIRMIQDGK